MKTTYGAETVDLGTIQVLRQKRWVGGVRKWQFLLIYSTIYAHVDGWASKKAKNMLT